jgi:hypothetical protein
MKAPPRQLLPLVMLIAIALLCIALVAAGAAATELPTRQHVASEWQKLFDGGKIDEEEHYCTPLLASEDSQVLVEAHICLANVALARGSVIRVSRRSMGSGYSEVAAKAALKHLDAALALGPNDLSIHLGRLHILETSGHALEMADALEDSISRYKGKGALEAWLAYCPELMDMDAYEAGLKFCRVLQEH